MECIIKQFKPLITIFMFLSIFILGGCDEGGNKGSGPSISSTAAASKNDVMTHSTIEVPLISRLSLLSSDGVVYAGEIDNSDDSHLIVTVQVPAETIFPATFTISFNYGFTLQTYDNVPVPNNTKQTFQTSGQDVAYVAVKGGVKKNYSIIVVKRDPYFTHYTDNCVKDLDGNIWPSNPFPKSGFIYGSWQNALNKVGSFNACGLTNWQLPSLKQAQVLLNKVPLRYRSKSDGGTTGTNAPIQWFNMQ
ncbi:MAG TPA: hypothetical protein VKR58_15450, partial [Aquella sp.]|nr:hypothetical protein [Aquella sp.]